MKKIIALSVILIVILNNGCDRQDKDLFADFLPGGIWESESVSFNAGQEFHFRLEFLGNGKYVPSNFYDNDSGGETLSCGESDYTITEEEMKLTLESPVQCEEGVFQLSGDYIISIVDDDNMILTQVSTSAPLNWTRKR